jgi:hypothetical protein
MQDIKMAKKGIEKINLKNNLIKDKIKRNILQQIN